MLASFLALFRTNNNEGLDSPRRQPKTPRQQEDNPSHQPSPTTSIIHQEQQTEPPPSNVQQPTTTILSSTTTENEQKTPRNNTPLTPRALAKASSMVHSRAASFTSTLKRKFSFSSTKKKDDVNQPVSSIEDSFEVGHFASVSSHSLPTNSSETTIHIEPVGQTALGRVNIPMLKLHPLTTTTSPPTPASPSPSTHTTSSTNSSRKSEPSLRQKLSSLLISTSTSNTDGSKSPRKSARKSTSSPQTFDSLFDETKEDNKLSTSTTEKSTAIDSPTIQINKISSGGTGASRGRAISQPQRLEDPGSFVSPPSPTSLNVDYLGSNFIVVGSNSLTPMGESVLIGSPRVSFTRVTSGTPYDESYLSDASTNYNSASAQTPVQESEGDEYQRLMNSENGREIFFQYIQKHAHSEQIDFLQETIQLYQNNATVVSNNASPLMNMPATDDETHWTIEPSSMPNIQPSNLASVACSPHIGNSMVSSSFVGTTHHGLLSSENGKKSFVSNISTSSSDSLSSDRISSPSDILIRYKQHQHHQLQLQLQQAVNSPSPAAHIHVGFTLYNIDQLITRFIVENSPKELNLSKKQRQKVLGAFEKLKSEKLEKLNREVYTEHPVKEIPSSVYEDIPVSEEEFVEIFRELINIINYQLKMECFGEFKRSTDYLDVILNDMGVSDVMGVTTLLATNSRYSLQNQNKIDSVATPRRRSFFGNNENQSNTGGKEKTSKRRLSENDASVKPESPKSPSRTGQWKHMKNPLELLTVFTSTQGPNNR